MADTCSIGRVIDALMLVPALPDYAASFTDVVVVDGPWLGADMPDRMVLIGLLATGNEESGGEQQIATMGYGGRIQEDYGIVCESWAWAGDADPGAQKRVRDQALAQFAVFEQAIRGDRTVYDLIEKPPTQLPELWVERNSLSQVSEDVDMGRFASLQFTVHVRNSLNY